MKHAPALAFVHTRYPMRVPQDYRDQSLVHDTWLEPCVHGGWKYKRMAVCGHVIEFVNTDNRPLNIEKTVTCFACIVAA